MIKIAGKELAYSASVILHAGETAIITPTDFPGSVIELSVESEKGDATGLEGGLNSAKLSVWSKDGLSTSVFALHTPNMWLLDCKIIAQTLGVMTKFDLQVTRKQKIS